MDRKYLLILFISDIKAESMGECSDGDGPGVDCTTLSGELRRVGEQDILVPSDHHQLLEC